MKKLTIIVSMLALSLLITSFSYTVCATTIDTNYTIGDGTTTWVNTTSAVGDWSLQLYWPKPGSNYAGLIITDLGDVKVKDFTGWSYWANAPENYIPNFNICLDTPLANYAGINYDTNIYIWPSNDGQGDQWLQFLSSNSLPYTIWSNGVANPVMKSMTWAEFQAPFSQWGVEHDYGEAIITQIRIWNGGIGTNSTITAYVDDFALNGANFPMENPVPLPGTLMLLGSGLVGLASLRLRRRWASLKD